MKNFRGKNIGNKMLAVLSLKKRKRLNADKDHIIF